MTFQGIIIGLIFGIAVFYIGKKVFSGFFKSDSKAGCDKCELPNAMASKEKSTKLGTGT